MISWTKSPVFVALSVAVLVAVMGGGLTQIGPWYEGLNKPPWNPPNWLFGPVWTFIYACVVTAAVRGWRHVAATQNQAWFLTLFGINIGLNVLWSALFFTLQRPDWALVEVVFLWLSVLALVLTLGRWDRRAGLFLLPYLVWTGFAGWLNFTIVELNAPFGA